MDRDLMLRMFAGGAKFQYIEKPLIAYRMGGASDKSFFSKTLPEGREISIKYGMPVWKANLSFIYKYMKARVIFLLRDMNIRKA